MFVLGTAGHVDHGKSTLIHALTGIDPDRLREEKERAMTIDLGFAWLKLPGGREVSIVDVPGHERFIKNMLAGVGGIDLALLVIAADEGVMPQTREHLAILDLLRVERGIVVVTKKDLVDEELLEMVQMEVAETLQETTLSQAPIIAVSSTTGEGLDRLLSVIDNLLDNTSPKKDTGRPRLPIDRVFTISGFGTVVTGTLIDGQLSVGQEVEILPHSLKTRLRGLQTHKTKVEKADPGTRVAANLAGLATTQLERGDVITTPGWLVSTSVVDVRVRLISQLGHPLKHNTNVSFHSGSVETEAKVRLLEKEQIAPGESGWAQLKLERPVAVVKGDFFIIRSTMETLGGGQIIDAYPKRHRRFHDSTIEALTAREQGGTEGVIIAILETKEPLGIKELSDRSNLPSQIIEEALKSLAGERKLIILGEKSPNTVFYSTKGWDRLSDKVKQIVGGYHRQFSLRRGIPKEELRSKLKVSPSVFIFIMEKLVQDGILAEESKTVHLQSHKIQLSVEQEGLVENYIQSLNRNPYSPPGDLYIDPEILNVLLRQRRVVKVAENVIFTASAYDNMVESIKVHIKSQGRITVGEVRDLFKTSRKYALAIMEYLDEQKITRRVGDERVMV